MKTKARKTLFHFIVLTVTISVNISQANNRKFECINCPDERTNFVYSQIPVPDLPETGLLRAGITIDRSIVAGLVKATFKGGSIRALTPDVFLTKEPWIGGAHNFGATYHVDNPEPLPTNLPPEIEKNERERLASRQKRNPDFDIEKHLEKKLEGYQKSKEKLLKGIIRIEIVNTPSPKAAFEYLVSYACGSSMMSELIIPNFEESNRLENIGTVGYGLKGIGPVYFIRDNIAVIIVAYGEFEQQGLEIAKKIDAKLLKQPLLTHDQLKARCPQVTLEHKRHEIVREKGRTPVVKPDDIFCEVSVPAGIDYTIRETKIDGKDMVFKNRKQLYYDDRREDKTKPLKVEMTVVSDELLVTRVSRDLEVSEN